MCGRSTLLILIVACSVIAQTALAQSVLDGDMLYVGRQKVRLCGIDAPEWDAPGGEEATMWLRLLIAGKTVRCVPVGQGTPCDGRSKARSYDGIVAQCFVGNQDIAADMIRSGHAKDWPEFSGGHYAR